MQSEFTFRGHTICIPPPAYPPGAAAFEHQRAMGIDQLQPSRSDARGKVSEGVNAAFLPSATAYKVWPCAQALAEWLHASPDAPKLDGRNVLELGAGCGLAGLSAWCGGATHVCLTDLPENLERLRDVVKQNKATANITVTALDWTQELLPQPVTTTNWDVILAADCVFWPGLFAPLLATLGGLHMQSNSRINPCRIILCLTDRLGRGRQFLDQASDAGWIIRPLCTHEQPKGLQAGSLEMMRRESCLLYEFIFGSSKYLSGS